MAFNVLHWLRAFTDARSDWPSEYRLVALALAKYANKQGRAWPGIRALEADTATSRHTVIRAIHQLTNGGWCTRDTSPGKLTQYQLVSDVHQYPTCTGAPETPGGAPGTPPGGAPGTTKLLSTTTQLTTQSAETVPAPPSKSPRPRKISVEVYPIVQDIMARLAAVRGYTSPMYSAELVAANQMVKNGFTPDLILDCYRHFKAEAFWAEKELKLMTVAGNIHAWKASRNHPGGQNATRKLPFGSHTAEEYWRIAGEAGQLDAADQREWDAQHPGRLGVGSGSGPPA